MIATVGVSEKDALAPYYERARRDTIFTVIISFLVLLFSVLVCLVLLHRKRSLEQVKESELKYRFIFEKSHDAILLMQPGGLMIAVNPAACRVFEMPQARIRKSSWLQLVSRSDPNYRQLSDQGPNLGDSQARGDLRQRKRC